MIKPHFDGKRYSYPDNGQAGSRWDVLRWAMTRKKAKWPKALVNPPPAPVVDEVGERTLRLTFINHATVLMQCNGVNIITDPVFSKRVSPVSFAGPARFRPAGLSIDALPRIHAVLISHSHYDHLDVRSLYKLIERDNPLIVTPLGTAHIINKRSQHPITELNWWESHDLNPETRIVCVPARHWTSRKPGDENTSLWGGFVVRFASGSVYFAGDTGYGDGEHFRLAARHLGPFRCALLPIGAYEPRWFMKPQHMNPAEAVLAFKDLQTAYALGIHHGTFQLTDEPIDAPLQALAYALEEHSIDSKQFLTLPNGGAWEVPDTTPVK